MPTFTVAGLQLELPNADNIDLCEHEIRLAKSRYPWLDMILLPELATFGTALDRAQPMPGPAERRYAALARELGTWLLPGSLYERRRGQIFNTAPVIAPDGRVVARYRKMFPWTPYERGVTPGREFVVFDVPGVGRLFVTAIINRDVPVILGTTLLYAVALLCLNLVADLAKAALDPRTARDRR